jgi:hypothetical protein
MGQYSKRLLFAAIESPYGTSANPGGTAAIMVNDDFQITPLDADELERTTLQPHFGTRRKFLINQKVQFSFSVDVAGSGIAGTAPKWGRLLQACGFSETVVASTSVTYNLKTDNTDIAGLTVAGFMDSQKHLATGCRGSAQLMGKVGEFFRVMFNMTGIYAAPTDAALPSATFGNHVDPLHVSNGNTTNLVVNSWNGACLSEFDFNLNNSTNYRELVGCTRQVRINDRQANGKIVIESPSLSAYNAFTAATTSAIGTVSFSHADSAGGSCAVTARCNFGAPTYADMDNITMIDIPVGLVPSTAGNDELILVFT